MKRFMILACACMALCSNLRATAPLNLVPYPKSVKQGEAKVLLTASSRIVCKDPELKPLAEVVAEELYRITALKLKVAAGSGSSSDITLALAKGANAEGYTLVAGSQGVVIQGNSYRGVAWGTATMLQMLEQQGAAWSVPGATIADEPEAPYRGILVDLARNWHPVQTLRPLVEMCRLYKINTIQIHLNDGDAFSFPSKDYPELATPNKSYTRKELLELIAYADARGVTFVPEMSGPGHHAGNMRKLSPRGNTMDVWNEKTYEKLAPLFKDLAETFASSPYLHVGADEGSFGHLGKSDEEKAFMEKAGAKNPLNYYLSRMHKIIVKDLGKTMICWEGFHGDGGGLPKDIIVMPFDSIYNPPPKLAAAGFSLICTPWRPLYVVNNKHWPASFIYDEWNYRLWMSHINLKMHYQLPESAPVLGAQMCAWEQKADIELPSLRCRVHAMSERTWNPKLGQKYADFAPRAEKTDALLGRVLGMVAVTTDGLTGVEDRDYWLFTKETLTVTLSAPPIGKLRYTLDGKDPEVQSPLYEKPLTLSRDQTRLTKLFYNRQIGNHTAEGYTLTLKTALFDEQGKMIGDTVTHRNYWHKGAEIEVNATGLNGEKERDVEKFDTAVTVTLSPAGKGVIHYTLNGRDPTASDPTYTKPIVLTDKDCKKQGILFSRAKRKFEKEENVVILRARLFTPEGTPLPGNLVTRTYWHSAATNK